MADSNRLHRKNPGRSGPIRNFSGVFRSESGIDPAASATPNGATTSEGYAVRDEPIGLAYRVIEKHISDGKQNAGLFNGQPYNTRPMTDGFQDLLERTIRFQSEIIPLWIEALTSSVKVDPMRTPDTAAAAPHLGGKDTPRQDSRAISVEITSLQPVQVSIELKDDSERLPLVALGLRAVEPNTPVLGDVTFFPETLENPLLVKVSIVGSCSPGAYSGVIVNRLTGELRGTLTVRVAK
jgi:hypothetical protein